jgi:hypothetical protein
LLTETTGTLVDVVGGKLDCSVTFCWNLQWITLKLTLGKALKPGSHDEISISTGTFDVHKRKHKKNATFVLLMFMLMHIKGSAACAYAYFIVWTRLKWIK